jgi:two-component system, NarL family, nitrate/nitrite response regulator NarL
VKGSQGRIRILMADDHPMFRQGLRALLESKDDLVVVGEATNGSEAVSMAQQILPDVLLLDVSMPGLSGFDVLRQIAGLEGIRTIMLTAAITKSDIVQALQLGARGVVWKDVGAEILCKSIRCVMNDQLWVSRETVSHLVDTLRTMPAAPSRNEPEHVLGAPANETTVARPKATEAEPNEKANEKAEERVSCAKSNARRFGLTARELEIITAIVDGQSNRDIALTYKISEYTVKHHLTRIFDKVGVFSRLELAMFAIHHDLSGHVRETSSQA